MALDMDDFVGSIPAVEESVEPNLVVEESVEPILAAVELVESSPAVLESAQERRLGTEVSALQLEANLINVIINDFE